LHSPLVGPSTWRAAAGELRARGERVALPDLRAVADAQPPFWRTIADISDGAAAELPADDPLVVCAHSNAGLFAPVVAAHLGRPVAGLIFVDALVPPDASEVAIASPALLHDIERKASDGIVPQWTEWWPEEDVRALFPDQETRRRITAEVPRLSLAYYRDRVPVPPGWRRLPAAYVLFSEAYAELAEQAGGRGWPVRHLQGEHLHMLVDPSRVAATLCDIAGQWTPGRRFSTEA
jgi:pimeloyl-ACP methyl ester carboxylesterase